MMSFQKALDKIAVSKGYKDWDSIDFYAEDRKNKFPQGVYSDIIYREEAIALYGREMYNQAITDCAKSVRLKSERKGDKISWKVNKDSLYKNWMK
jgi:hypothetical protein